MSNLVRCFFKNCQRSSILRSWLVSSSRNYGTWEPDYLDDKPDIPEYDTLHIQMKAHDYSVLESYAKYVHNLVQRLKIENNAYAAPPKSTKINVFKPWSSNIEHSYELDTFERVVEISKLPSTVAPILLTAISQNLPQGLKLSFKKPDPVDEDFRYVPDLMLMDLQSQVEEIEQEKADRKK